MKQLITTCFEIWRSGSGRDMIKVSKYLIETLSFDEDSMRDIIFSKVETESSSSNSNFKLSKT